MGLLVMQLLVHAVVCLAGWEHAVTSRVHTGPMEQIVCCSATVKTTHSVQGLTVSAYVHQGSWAIDAARHAFRTPSDYSARASVNVRMGPPARHSTVPVSV